MKKASFILSVLLLCGFHTPDPGFHAGQMKAPKVALAYQEKWPEIKARLKELKVDPTGYLVYIRVFKAEKILEVWVSNGRKKTFRKFGSYAICASSGQAGPKRSEGDGQVPEGFYDISVFNPYSNYYISLGLNYPNKSDRILSSAKSLGGAIMIHGNCVTIGCIPLTDDKIKEVYILAEQARSGGQEVIPVHLFPSRMTATNMQALSAETQADKSILIFWKNLKTGYDFFEAGNILPDVSVAPDGSYRFQ
jgi:murein L,D-transpeptidase YafK